MALNCDGHFGKDGYLGQARLVERYIPASQNSRVLEIAAGQGYNSIYLARQHPNATFSAFDFLPKHIKFAERKARYISNIELSVANFEDMPFTDSTFDVAFVVESICHAEDLRRAFEESYRVLRPGGKLVVFDAFRTDEFESLNEDLKLAARLTEASMAVGHGWRQNEWIKLAESVGFTVTEQVNLTQAIRPNLLRLQGLARRFFRRPARAAVIKWLLPMALIENSIAGLLMQPAARTLAAPLSPARPDGPRTGPTPRSFRTYPTNPTGHTPDSGAAA